MEKEKELNAGTLYICGTPLGNLEDITLRALKVLGECDLIAAEDTRRTIKLLNHYEIKTSLTSYHEHNEKFKGAKLIEELLNGKNICLVSDAGMPGISDPGHIIIKMAVEEGINVVPIPGPTAGISALVVSGLSTDRFVFEGFLPREKKKRAQTLTELSTETRTIILYEAPHRLKKTLKLLFESLGDRRIVLAREITKIHEEFIQGRLSEIVENSSSLTFKGEYCLVVEGSNKKIITEQPEWAEAEIIQQVKELINKGLSKKSAIKEAAALLGLPKRKVYNLVIKEELD